MCVNFDFIEFGGMTQRKFWYGYCSTSTPFTYLVNLINTNLAPILHRI